MGCLVSAMSQFTVVNVLAIIRNITLCDVFGESRVFAFFSINFIIIIYQPTKLGDNYKQTSFTLFIFIDNNMGVDGIFN